LVAFMHCMQHHLAKKVRTNAILISVSIKVMIKYIEPLKNLSKN
jgi:hypothetical protein